MEKVIGQVTKEQIAGWKEQHRDVFAIKVEDSEGKLHVCYLRRPRRRDLSAATVAGQANPLKFNEVIMRQCWLGGDEEIRKDDALFLSASGKLPDLIEVAEAELEKL